MQITGAPDVPDVWMFLPKSRHHMRPRILEIQVSGNGQAWFERDVWCGQGFREPWGLPQRWLTRALRPMALWVLVFDSPNGKGAALETYSMKWIL